MSFLVKNGSWYVRLRNWFLKYRRNDPNQENNDEVVIRLDDRRDDLILTVTIRMTLRLV